MEDDESDLTWVATGENVGEGLGWAESEGLVVVIVSRRECGEEAGILSNEMGDVEPLIEFLLEEFCSSGAFNIL